ncbi:MAG: dockerin type I repeat-containing protein [Bacteroidaceae bacterium]|nr:dockerin type I repeat-containing protein [Bacteroidaceae bacterium]
MKRRFLFLMMAVCSFVGANAAINRANNYLAADDATGEQGKTVEVTLRMTNDKQIINWQTDLVLPEGVTLVSVAKAGVWAEDITVTGNKLFSETETPVGANQKAEIATITLQIDAAVAAGEYELKLDNIVMNAVNDVSIAQTEAKVFKLTVTEPVNPGIKGDVNGDGEVNVMDAVAVYDIMAGNAERTDVADVNNDGDVNVMDVVAIYDIMAGNN